MLNQGNGNFDNMRLASVYPCRILFALASNDAHCHRMKKYGCQKVRSNALMLLSINDNDIRNKKRKRLSRNETSPMTLALIILSLWEAARPLIRRVTAVLFFQRFLLENLRLIISWSTEIEFRVSQELLQKIWSSTFFAKSGSCNPFEVSATPDKTIWNLDRTWMFVCLIPANRLKEHLKLTAQLDWFHACGVMAITTVTGMDIAFVSEYSVPAACAGTNQRSCWDERFWVTFTWTISFICCQEVGNARNNIFTYQLTSLLIQASTKIDNFIKEALACRWSKTTDRISFHWCSSIYLQW